MTNKFFAAIAVLAGLLSVSSCGLGESSFKNIAGTYNGQEWPVENGVAFSPEFAITLTIEENGDYTLIRYNLDESNTLFGTYSGKASWRSKKIEIDEPYYDSFEKIMGSSNDCSEFHGSKFILYNMVKE